MADLENEYPVGTLVELTGLPDQLQAEELLGTSDDSPPAPISPNGVKGKVIEFGEEGKLIVETFGAVMLVVAKENVKKYTPEKPADGGFHVAWPADDELAAADFAVGAVEALMKDGYCVVQMAMSDSTRQRAMEEAKRMKYHRMKKEFEAAYLGRQYKCKTAWLDELAETKMMAETAFDQFDVHFSSFTKFMLPLAPTALDFVPYSRTNAMVRVPFESAAEEGKYLAEELEEEDINDGLVDSHISFVKRKALCMLFVVATSGGDLTLIPKDEDKENIALELTAGRMIIFPHNTTSYIYNPIDSNDLVMQSWILQEPEQLTFVSLIGDQQSKDEALGVHVGPNQPLGQAIQVFGMGLGIPAGGTTEGRYWGFLANCVDGCTKVPYTRYDMDLYSAGINEWVPGTTYAIHSGLMSEDIYAVDNEFFNISEDEAVIMAPAQKGILEKGYEALYNSGYRRAELGRKKIGIFAGHSGDDWSFTPVFTLGYEDKFRNSHGARMWSSLPGRLAYTLGIKGPQSLVDTACSSALCAYGVGHTMLRRTVDEQVAPCIDVHLSEALMMGANMLPGPGGYISCCGPHMLSVIGRCFTYDSSADGFCRGEGCGAFLVKAETQKVTDSFATVIGACCNQDGRSASMTAPNGPAQQECIKGSMKEAGLSANQVTCAECHGTGTALGDPIEVGALKGVMQDRVIPIYQTSAKAHIGHLEACAGLAGIVKCMLMCRAAAGSPNCHFYTLNPHLDTAGYPTAFASELSDFGYNAGYSGVSSFGFGGANARADVYAAAAVGPHSTGELDWKQVDYITVSCPFDQGPMHYLDGRCVPRASSKKYKHEVYHADAIRDEFDRYDCNSSLYSGKYHMAPRDDDEMEDAPTDPIFVVGSWDNFREAHEMEKSDEGDAWTFQFALSETRCERFQLRMKNSEFEAFYPVVQDGGMTARCMGPDDQGIGMHWLLDARDEQVPVGTVYEITLQWGEPPTLRWEKVPDALIPEWANNFRHFYSVVSSWTGGQCEPMKDVSTATDPNTWEAKVRIGLTGREWFRFCRDNCANQSIYPARNGCSEEVPVCGPDIWCNDKGWRITGKSGELTTLRLQVVDGHVTVTVMSSTMGTRVMHSVDGPKHHTYYVCGSFNDWKPEDMVLDEESLATFRYRGTVGESGYEHFFISVDADPGLTFFPEATSMTPGTSVVLGPSDQKDGRVFAISCLRVGAQFEIELNRHAEDKRRIVTVKWLDDRVDTESMKAAFLNYRGFGLIPPGLMVDDPAEQPFE